MKIRSSITFFNLTLWPSTKTFILLVNFLTEKSKTEEVLSFDMPVVLLAGIVRINAWICLALQWPHALPSKALRCSYEIKHWMVNLNWILQRKIEYFDNIKHSFSPYRSPLPPPLLFTEWSLSWSFISTMCYKWELVQLSLCFEVSNSDAVLCHYITT